MELVYRGGEVLSAKVANGNSTGSLYFSGNLEVLSLWMSILLVAIVFL